MKGAVVADPTPSASPISSLAVRRATIEDAEDIARVHAASWAATYEHMMPGAALGAFSLEQRRIQWRAALAGGDPDVRAFVATDRAIIGFACTGPAATSEDARHAELRSLYLDRAAWRRGVGRALFRAAVSDLEARGGEALVAWVLEANTRARGFYEAVGMRRAGASEIFVIAGEALPHVRYALSLGG